jgi:hypothetical protein
MTASRHRRLARTGGHPPRRAPVSKCAPCYRAPAPRVNARFCRSETDTERRTRCSASPSNYRPSARNNQMTRPITAATKSRWNMPNHA